ncbi:hypothetical protein FSP39_010842 [Pinctada imbricata]|uniref:Mab-21-like HhH/H2TH-like domain-containing protein n=1 Tax=Pinctada imbricata TaxID=66713 RepID=A0AA89C3J6_PINIB|nr:hypothetical protein FSP39_010842 [Pinctada imbricata]
MNLSSTLKMARSNEELCRISEGLCSIVNWKIGPECVVRTRRQQYAFDSILDSCDMNGVFMHVMSGSRAEGFELESSDFDIMLINKNVLVIDHELQNVLNTAIFPVVLHMETDNVPPGFTLLKCIRYDSRPKDDNIHAIISCLILRGKSVYMSSQKAQKILLWSGKSSVHGPCRSGTVYGLEYDCAYTLKCPFWPKQANSFISRSIRNGWPTADELIGICKDGCLLVAINSKQQLINDNADLEWRISFSLAEKKLVYSMNHCQFLCYGLMKIFLNEVLKEIPKTKTETGNVLCSYFMKTAVFWEISEYVNDWTNQTFLNKFLNVFRRIIKWVEDGYCPNFFIPEHNMFFGKIYGERQRELMLRLRSLYDEGIMCLYRCSSFGDLLLVMLNDRFCFNLIQKHADDASPYIKENAIICMIIMAHSVPIPTNDISDLKNALWYTATLVPESEEILSVFKLRVNFILQHMALIYAIHGDQNLSSNKSQYLITKRARSILRKTNTSYCLSTILQAVISYVNEDYHKTIKIIDYIQQRLQNQPYTHMWDLDPFILMESRQQGMSYEDIVKTFVISFYEFNHVISIRELTLETFVREVNCPSGTILHIPTLVFL